VRLDISHSADADLQVFLAQSAIPVGPVTYRKLFGDVCGYSDNVQAILDDEAAQPIGSVCPPAGFQRYQTQTRMTLRSFNGGPARGEWILRVADDTAGNSGRINGYTLEFKLR
jgi:hypothetical protein